MMSSSVQHFDDPEQYGTTVHNACVSIRPDRPGPYAARLTLVRLPGIHLGMGEETVPRRLHAEFAPDRVFLSLVHGDVPPGERDGAVEPEGTIAVGTGGRKEVLRSFGPSRWRSVSIAYGDLAARAERLLGRAMPALLPRANRVRPPALAFMRLASLQREALRLAQASPTVLAHPVASRSLDEQLGEALLALLDTLAPAHDSLAARRGHVLLRRVEAYVAEHGGRPIALGELCAAAGCSARTLETLFLATLGQTPRRHLRLRRLWRAREILLRASAAETSVTAAALDCGFWELGRFAVAYRAAFGEAPSVTLHRPPFETSGHSYHPGAPFVLAETA